MHFKHFHHTMQLRPIMNRFLSFLQFFSHLIRQVHHTSLDLNLYYVIWNSHFLGVSSSLSSQNTPFYGQDSKKECSFKHVHLHTFIYSWTAACGSRLPASFREHLYTVWTPTRLVKVHQTTVLVLIPSALVITTN